MRTLLPILIVLLFCACDGPKKAETSLVPVQVDEAAAYPKQDPGTRPPVLTGFQELAPEQLAEGWIQLFDGVSTYGWISESQNSRIVVKKLGSAPILFQENTGDSPSENLHRFCGTGFGFIVKEPAVFGFVSGNTGFKRQVKTIPNNHVYVGVGGGIEGNFQNEFIGNVLVRPIDSQSLAEADWKPATEKCKAVWNDGVLELSGGSGMIETVKEYGDFVLQLEYYTETPKEGEKGVNSGVFFRCIPGEMMNGYECQVFNNPPAEDYEKFIGTDTGGIFRRCVGRNVGPKDGQWNHLTVAARGPMIATWVNGIQTVDWTDTRKEDDNPRKGLRIKPGTIQLQGHDSGTKIQFRNIRISNLNQAGVDTPASL